MALSPASPVWTMRHLREVRQRTAASYAGLSSASSDSLAGRIDRVSSKNGTLGERFSRVKDKTAALLDTINAALEGSE